MDPDLPEVTGGILGVDEYHIRYDARTKLFKGVSRNFHPSASPSDWQGIFTGNILRSTYSSLKVEEVGLVRTYSSGDDVCSICMEPYAHKATTPCAHSFCAACICQ